jgi:D-alanyl-D-alanine carboxypeptidase
MATLTSRWHLGHTTSARRAFDRRAHWYWLGSGLALFFVIPFVLTDLAPVGRDLYYGVYIAAVAAFCGSWLRFAVDEPRATLTRNWRLGVVLGAVFGGVMAAIVLKEPSSGHPGGTAFVAAVLWRGVVYGLADGVILSAFPILAVFAAFGSSAGRRRVGVGMAALCASLVFTAVYHVGYSDFRGDKLRKPLVGDLIWSVPTLATLSPLGAPIAHAGMHVTAVVHAYDTDTFLPPHEEGLDGAPLEALLDSAVSGQRRLAPGATAYVENAAGSWNGASGLADVRLREPMTPDARMRLESVSKIWTAVLIYGLAQDGALRLTDTVEQWLPDLLPYGNRITIDELLAHRSGLVDNNDIVASPAPYISRVTDPAFRQSLIQLRRRLQRDPTVEFSPRVWIRLAAYQPLLSAPGTTYHYSNIGFEILGLVAERAGGESMGALYRHRIFEPLHLADTAYDPQGAISGPHARGYALGALRDTTAAHPGVGAEGGIVSNARDTARFLLALMRGDLLAPESLAKMKEGFWSGGQPSGCRGAAFGHSGGGWGFKTDVWVAGDGSRVAVVLLNGRGDTGTDYGAAELMHRLYCTPAHP